jgi:hypothetical protein
MFDLKGMAVRALKASRLKIISDRQPTQNQELLKR